MTNRLFTQLGTQSDHAKETARTALDRISTAYGNARTKSEDLIERGRHRADASLASSRHFSRDVAGQATAKIQQQPLIALGASVAIGFMLGALLKPEA